MKNTRIRIFRTWDFKKNKKRKGGGGNQETNNKIQSITFFPEQPIGTLKKLFCVYKKNTPNPKTKKVRESILKLLNNIGIPEDTKEKNFVYKVRRTVGFKELQPQM